MQFKKKLITIALVAGPRAVETFTNASYAVNAPGTIMVGGPQLAKMWMSNGDEISPTMVALPFRGSSKIAAFAGSETNPINAASAKINCRMVASHHLLIGR
jgi:hypothetical protein